MKRILDCQASDFRGMTRQELLQAISGGEGRTIAIRGIRHTYRRMAGSVNR